jgi:Bacterial membrane protein YfhO
MDKKKSHLASSLTDLAVIGILVLAILCFCQDLIVGGEVPFFRDLGTYFYPLRLSVAESLRAGELPLWDRRLAQGFPLMAAFQPGVFYPPHILLAFVPFFLGIQLLFVFHFIVAAVGTYKLVRYWRHTVAIAVIGALTFSLGGTIVSLSNLLNHFQSAVWLPWLILSWERLVCMRTWRKFLVFTVIAALQFLAGSPEFFAMSLILVVLDGFRVQRDDQRLSAVRLSALLAAALLLMVAVCSVQILPTAELFLDSRRQQSIPAEEVVAWSLHPGNLLNLFFLDRQSDLSSAAGMRYLLGAGSPFFISYYLGSIAFLGLCFYFYYRSRRERLLASAFIVISVLLALGGSTPVYPYLLRHIPWLSTFRFPEKLFFLTYAGLIFITIKGLAAALDDNVDRIRPTAMLLGAICLFWVIVYASAFFGSESLYKLTAARLGLDTASAINVVGSVLANLERQLLLILTISLIVFLNHAKKLKPSLTVILLVGVVFIDLLAANRGFLFSMNSSVIVNRSDDNRRSLSADTRTFYYPSGKNLHPSSIVVKGRPSYPEFVSLWFRNLLPNAGIFYGAEYMQEIDALARTPYTAFLVFANELEPQEQIRLLRAFNVGQIVSFQPLSIDGLNLSKTLPEVYSWIYNVDRPLPRAYVVNRSAVEKQVMSTLQRLADREFDPREQVLLDREIAVPYEPKFEAKSQILRYKNARVTIETETSNDGILVLLDSYYPGWKAYVDGFETPIARANHFYRAVAVPRGRHLVEFKYEPLSFKIGLLISSMTLVALLFISLALFLKSALRN